MSYSEFTLADLKSKFALAFIEDQNLFPNLDSDLKRLSLNTVQNERTIASITFVYKILKYQLEK